MVLSVTHELRREWAFFLLPDRFWGFFVAIYDHLSLATDRGPCGLPVTGCRTPPFPAHPQARQTPAHGPPETPPISRADSPTRTAHRCSAAACRIDAPMWRRRPTRPLSRPI